VTTLAVDPATCRTYAEGWQSWSPTRVRGYGQGSPWPAAPNVAALGYRAGSPPDGALQGEGLLAVQTSAAGPTAVFADLAGARPIRARWHGAALAVEGEPELVVDAPLEEALAVWARALPAVGVRPAPTVWCSWYRYGPAVTEADVLENLDAMAELSLPIDVVQLDDGWQAEVGDWLRLSDRFADLPAVVRRIREAGRRPGIWVAPFLLGERAQVPRSWRVPGASAGRNWGQELHVLDVARGGPYLREVFGMLRSAGFDYFKIDFTYAGALAGVEHYREGLRIVREAIGDAYLVACGAPIVPSIGGVDAMRISPDTAWHVAPSEGDLSQPGQASAIGNGVARAWQDGRLWVNDPDCLLAAPGVEQRHVWADHVARHGSLVASGDRLRDLDQWGLATTRRLLQPRVSPSSTW
jgi:alpha-galactosidase